MFVSFLRCDVLALANVCGSLLLLRTRPCIHDAEHTLFVYILHLSGYLKKKRSHCVLYATKRQFQNKSQLGRICKLHVSRKIIGFKYFLNIFTVRPHRKSFQLFKLYRNIKNRRRVFRKISVFFECFGDFFFRSQNMTKNIIFR